MLKSEALEYMVLTVPHTCMYDTYKASYKLSKLSVTDTQTHPQTFVLLELLSQLKKKVWNFPYFSGVGGFEKVIFHKKKNKKHGLKMPKIA